MQQCLTALVLFFFCSALHAQTNRGLIAYFPFDGNLEDATGNTLNRGQPTGTISFGCGLESDALDLGNAGAHVVVEGPVNDRFSTNDFTVAFYFQPNGGTGNQLLFSKRDSLCGPDNAITIRYNAPQNRVEVELRENSSKNLDFAAPLPEGRCWQHITLVRRANRVRFFLNGTLIAEGTNSSRLNLDNEGLIWLGYSFCPAVGEDPFAGRLEDLRIYGRDLAEEEVAGLYQQPDRILNPDTRIFLGESVNVQLGPTCGTTFSWTPTAGVSDPAAPDPIITPPVDGQLTYALEIAEPGNACLARDTLRITVINPDSLDCNSIFLPSAFTPNGSGPAVNETFGISNPQAVGELISLEVFDQWGGRLFATSDPFQRWDGELSGRAVNTRSVVYLLRWRCEGVEKVQRGAVAILR